MDKPTKIITTAIAYTNGPPHIGHTYEYVIADVVTRYYQTLDNRAYFLTGTDEHGQKIVDSATVLMRFTVLKLYIPNYWKVI